MNRRQFVKTASAVGGTLLTGRSSFATVSDLAVIDTHIHLFDTGRKGGVPWPEKGDSIYQPALPPRYEAMTKGLGIVGAIAIEASPLRSDNEWLIETAKKSPLIVGVIGDLDPAASDYASSLAQLQKELLFRGIRYGNLWNRDLTADLLKPKFLDGLKLLAEAGLVFESANPNPRLIQALVQVSERVPRLRIVLDHLPNAAVPPSGAERDLYFKGLRELGASPEVYVKLSEIGVAKPDLFTEQVARLDTLWDIFGEDKLMFGSDWPNSDHDRPFTQIYALFQRYMKGKPESVRQKVCWRNSKEAYGWKSRTPQQPKG